MPNATCAADNCEASRIAARGLCSRHYSRLRRYGDANHRFHWEVKDGKRGCPNCNRDMPVEDFSPGAAYCRPCVAQRKRDKYVPRPIVPLPLIYCIHCGVRFQPQTLQTRLCSKDCYRARSRSLDAFYAHRDGGDRANARNRAWISQNPDANHRKAHNYRARKIAAFVEDVDRAAVFERDEWVCQVCGDPVDPALSDRDPMMASLDHRVALANGGTHSYENCQLAHLRCNVAKGAKPM